MYEYVILGLLMYKSMTGYELKTFAEKTLGNFMLLSFASIYPTFNKLEKKKWVSSKEESINGRLNKTYTIEELGKNNFLKWLEEPIEISKGQQKELIKIFFFSFLSEEKIINLLNEYKEKLNQEIENIDKIIENQGEHHDYYHSTIAIYGKQYYQLLISLCNKILNKEKLF